ncbi:MAG: sulfurtransferase TusA family protein [Planctomycetota bacterium]
MEPNEPKSLVHDLDCRGLKCPMPIVRIAQAMQRISPGELLRVDASDPAFRADVRAWSAMTNNELVEFEAADGVQRAVLRKA